MQFINLRAIFLYFFCNSECFIFVLWVVSMVEQVRKRTGDIVPFDSDKIKIVLQKAFDSINEQVTDLDALVGLVLKELNSKFEKEVPSVEDVSDTVENILMKKHPAVAKSFIIYREYKRQLREVRKAYVGTVEKSNLSINAIRVLEARYLLKDNSGNIIETPNQLFERVADHIVRAEKKYLYGKKYNEMKNAFYEMMFNLDFLPNSPTLMNAGTDMGQLSACFVLPVADSISEIFDAVKYSAIIHQSGGGVGLAFSRLRPRGSLVKSTKGIASGPISFMHAFNAATETIKQGGCIATNSLVRTNKGILPIGKLLDCPPLGENRTKYEVFTNGSFANAFIAEDNGISGVYNIQTQLGTEIKATYNHKIGIIDDTGKFSWKEAEKLQNGDWIIHVLGGHNSTDVTLLKIDVNQHHNANKIKTPKTMNSEFAELLGLYMADGCISTNGRLIFAVEDKDIQLQNRIKELMFNLFNLQLGIIQRKPNDKSVCLVFYSKDLCNFFEKISCKKKGALHAFVPQVIFESSANSARAFVKGLFEGDGDIHVDGYPRLYSVSEKLVKEVQQLLFGLGIVSGVHKYSSKNRFGKNPIYHLTVIQQRSVNEFANNIGFISERKNKKLFERQKIKTYESVDVIPNQEDLLRSIYNGPGRGCGKGKSKLGANRKLYRAIQHYLDTKTSQRHLTRKKLKELLTNFKELRNPQLLKAVNDEYFFSPVVNIEKGKDYTMDIMVPETEHFVANSILVHNKRRGANMGVLRVDHPDILEFISCKQTEGNLANFNISVAMTDVFMNAVEQNQDYDLIDPKTGLAVSRLNARSVFDLIANMAWQNGEPGVIFIDEINRKHQVANMGVVESTNPCHRGTNLVHTDMGLLPIKELVTKKFNVLCQDGKKAQAKVFVTGKQKLYRVKFDNGLHIDLTRNHNLISDKNEKIEVINLKEGTKIALSKYSIIPNKSEYSFSTKDGFVLGWNYGDGWITWHSNKKVKNWQIGFVFGNEDKEIYLVIKQYFNKLGIDINGSDRLKTKGVIELTTTNKIARDLFLKDFKAVSKKEGIPITVLRGNREYQKGFLNGLFSSDGNVHNIRCGTKRVRRITLTSAHNKLIADVQLLLSTFGIVSRVRYSKTKLNGKEHDRFDLHINGKDVNLFAKLIGFRNKNKQKKLNGLLRAKWKEVKQIDYAKVVEVIDLKKTEEVFNLTVLDNCHKFAVNGIISANCGEQILLPFESCNLGSINLSNFVNKDGSIDWKRLRTIVELAVRFLDNVIDSNKYPLPQIENMTKSSRKIGLGVMGWADLLLQLKIPYNSDDAIYLAEKVMKFITDTSVEYSSYLGEIKGDFPAFKGSYWYQQGFKHMRNSTTTTIAPTGTIGMIADASSGVEPHFSLAYTRLTLDNQEFVYTNKYLDQELREKGVYSEELMVKISKTGMIDGLEGVPEDIKKVYVTSREIDTEWHLKMQAAFQKYTHNAVSKTINMPNFVTIEDVKKAYKLAYDLKCKGVTIYRDASREIQILNAGCATKTEDVKKPLLQKLITPEIPKDECPICHNKMQAQEGCYTCPKCSYSKCS